MSNISKIEQAKVSVLLKKKSTIQKTVKQIDMIERKASLVSEGTIEII